MRRWEWRNCQFLSEEGYSVGVVTIDRSSGMGYDDEYGEFLLLSKAAESHVRAICVYNVMMVSWVDGVAFRRGLGKISWAAWDDAAPELVNVTLE